MTRWHLTKPLASQFGVLVNSLKLYLIFCLKFTKYFLDLSESLIIVTADHASSMVYSGFATPKDHSILGMDKFVSNIDKKPYQLLLYSSGLGFDSYNETAAVSDHRNAYHKATIPSTWANHAGTDVPLYAIGSLANLLFSGTLDQTYIPHAIAFSMCLFEYQDRCQNRMFAQKPVMVSRERTPSKIHQLNNLLRQKNQKENFEEKRKLENIEEVTSPPLEAASLSAESSNLSIESSSVAAALFNDSEFDSINFVNNTEFELLFTSDLIGNSTGIEAGESKPSSLLTLMLFLVILIKFIR